MVCDEDGAAARGGRFEDGPEPAGVKARDACCNDFTEYREVEASPPSVVLAKTRVFRGGTAVARHGEMKRSFLYALRPPRPMQGTIVAGACAAALLALLLDGCSSSTTTGGQACANTPTPPAGDASRDDFCMALADYYGRCGHCSDCTEQNLQNCTKKGNAISAAYRTAFLMCHTNIPCTGLVGADPGGNPAFSPCIEQAMKMASPTAAQAQAKTAYCNACGATNAADCASFFESNGPGYNVLLSNDEVAAMAMTTCGSSCDPLKYGICVGFLPCGPSGGDYCADAGFCTPH
jgi:hypothetical protein